MTKILFVHNTAMWYRRPFFKQLNRLYDVKFIFTHIEICKNIYGMEEKKTIGGIENVNYKILPNFLGVAYGVIDEAMGDYDVLIGGSWCSLYELIETCLYLPIAKLRKKSFILYSEDWGRLSFFGKMITPFLKVFARIADAILVPGIKHKEYFISLGAHQNKIFIVPNACDIASIVSENNQKNHLDNKKTVLYVGRLLELKGVQYLIKAFSQLLTEQNDIILMIVGEGEYKKELKLLCKSLNIESNVRFMDHIEYEFLPVLYESCNVVVVPSCKLDAWVFVVNEAMHFGKPVIATDKVGAAFDMIKDGINGYIVPAKDDKSLYDAMKIVLSNSDLERKMGENSKKIIERFTYNHMVKNVEKAVEFVKTKRIE